MHVLLLAYHYPPDPAVGAVRPARMVQALRDRGHQVTVITARLPGEMREERSSEPGADVFAVKAIPNPRHLYLSAKRLATRLRSPAASPLPGGQPQEPQSASDEADVPLWKRAIFSMLWLPDDQQGFIPAAIARARRVHRDRRFDLLLTTAPPFSTHLAGLAIRRLTGVKWVADFRDPWTANPCKPAAVRTRATDAMEVRMERRVLRRADLVVSASAGIHRFFEQSGIVPAEKLLLIRNGIDSLQPGRQGVQPRGPFRILHMGTFYHGRDPRPFLTALSRVRAARGLGPDDVEVTFVGRSRDFRGEPISRMIDAAGLTDFVRFVDFVPREQAIALAAGADLLLLLAQDQPDQVPQKLYEYLGTRVPILAFADADGESAAMLREVGDHVVIADNSVSDAAAALEAALQARDREPAGDIRKLSAWTVDGQLAELIALIERLA